MEIKIGKRGIIREGIDQGFYIIIQDDSTNSGGYLIICNQSSDMSSQVGNDSWVADLEALKGFISESGWVIEWID